MVSEIIHTLMTAAIKRIAIIGPESSGKSELCEFLASHFKTVWVKEYARSYLPSLNRKYNIDDILEIYREQYKQELELIGSANVLVFIDTEFIIAKVWCESAFGKCPPYIEEMIRNFPYDLYLLTAADLPWELDPLRENPGKGDYYFEWYKRILEDYRLPYGIVSGTGIDRQESAIRIIQEFTGITSENIQKL